MKTKNSPGASLSEGGKTHPRGTLHTLSEFRREAGIPLVIAKKMVVWGEVKAVKIAGGTVRITEEEVQRVRKIFENPREKVKYYLRILGPGIITGASDDDPSGIGTYSSVGAMFGFAILWTAAWLLPVMFAIQEVSARIGIVANHGLANVIQKHYGKKIVLGIVSILIIANVVNIGADLGAMAASLKMLTGIDVSLAAVSFALIIIFIEIFFQYHVYVKVLKWLTLSVFAYIFAGIIASPNWGEVLANTFVPKIYWNENYIFALIAIFGTTVTPYLFFWQTSEEVEENKLLKIKSDKRTLCTRVREMRTDVGAGMLLANIVFFFIIVTTAQVLFKNGITNIGSAEQAALALKPLVGNFAYALFALGIIGTGLLAIPILAGSGAYALSEVMKWREGLELKFSRAKGFYLIIAFSIIVGLLINFIGIEPIKALYYSAYLNGIIALPLLIAIMIVGNDKRIMGAETHPLWVKIFGWLAVVFMFGAIAATILLAFK
ncbi:MAG TPA: divalent metal cation transporter [Candidatus Bathyarchaeia archaeon]|nr:divalent metal cation transporter [Candidatus Bathyarchaeia archaeon]